MNEVKSKTRGVSIKGRSSMWIACLIVFVCIVFATATLRPVHADIVDCEAGDVSCLRDSISEMWHTYGSRTINLQGGVYLIQSAQQLFDSESGINLLNCNITIRGVGTSGPNPTVIKRDEGSNIPDFRIFNVRGNSTLTLEGVVIENGRVNSSGGAIKNRALGRLVIRNSIIRNNSAGDMGGGIFNEGQFTYPPTLEINGSSILSNNAGRGGGIANYIGTVILKNSIIKDCVAIGDGGGIYNWHKWLEQDAILNISNTSILDNNATRGGGIYNDDGKLNISNSTIYGNLATDTGGGIRNYGWWNAAGHMIATNCTFANNNAHGSAGGIAASSYNFTKLINCTISGNSAQIGGGITAYGYTELQNTILAGNTAVSGPNSPPLNPVTSLGNNLIACSLGNCPTFVEGDIYIRNFDDPGLCAFTDDGKPGNGHFELQSSSCRAIDAGTNDVYLTHHQTHTDQLGRPRADGDDNDSFICDIGAVEYQHPSHPNRYRFIVMADSRACHCDPQNNWDIEDYKACINQTGFGRIMRSLKQSVTAIQAPPPSFILFVGDLVMGMESGTHVKNELDSWVEFVDDVMGMGKGYAKSRIYPVFGGHERNHITTDDGEYPYVWSAFSKVFDPVNNGFLGPSSCKPFKNDHYGNTVYYCDYQNLRFFVMNNDVVNSKCDISTRETKEATCWPYSHELGYQLVIDEIDVDQVTWLQEKLNDMALNFVTHHEPAYGSGAHNMLPPYAMDRRSHQRNEYIQILGESQNNVPIIFAGHEHQYTRRLINEEFANLNINLSTGPRIAESYNGSPRQAPLLYVEYYTDPEDVKTLEVRVADSSDDAEEFADGTVGLTSTDIELMMDVTKVQSHVGMRWTSVNIPQGATIKKAYIDFTCDETGSDDADITFYGEAADNAQRFTASDKNLSNRTKTNASVDWTGIPEWDTEGESVPEKHRTPDLSEIIQEIVNRPGWAGRNIVILAAPKKAVNFSREFYEVKTGSAGAPWKIVSKPEYLLNVVKKLIDIEGKDPWRWVEECDSQNHEPYHYAVVDVCGTDVSLNVYAVPEDDDGERIPIDQPSQNGMGTVQVATATGAGQLTVDLPGFELRNVDTFTDTVLSVDQQNKPPKEFPFGLTSMEIPGVGEGGTVTVELTFPSNIPTNYQYWKYQSNGGWYQIPFGSNDGDSVITITMTDGGVGDGDGVANGVITDPGGLGIPKLEIVNDLVTFEPIRSTYRSTYDTTGCTEGFVGKFSFDARLTNTSDSSLTDLVVKVAELTNDNLLQNADGGPGGKGSQLTVSIEDDYSDGVLGPGESIIVPFTICLKEFSSFRFFVDVLGTVR